MTHKQIFASGAVLVAALTIAACSGSTQGAAATSVPAADAAATSVVTPSAKTGGTTSDPCVLVTRKEASTAVGAAASLVNKQVSGCDYVAPTGEAVKVIVVRGITKAVFDEGRAKSQSDTGYQDVSGVGDAAYMASESGGGHFECFKSSISVTIILTLGREGEVHDALGTLGKTACGRL